MLGNRALRKCCLLWNLYLASFFESQVAVASGHDCTFLHFFASELSSFLGRNASCRDFKRLFPRHAGVTLHGGRGTYITHCISPFPGVLVSGYFPAFPTVFNSAAWIDIGAKANPKFSSWSLIPASFGRCFYALSVRLRPIVWPNRITQWVSRFQVFQCFYRPNINRLIKSDSAPTAEFRLMHFVQWLILNSAVGV